MDIKLISQNRLPQTLPNPILVQWVFFHTGGWAEVETLPRQSRVLGRV